MDGYHETTEPAPMQEGGLVNEFYYKGIPGLLKAIEIICMLLSFILVTAGDNCHTPTYGYYQFVSIMCFITTLILYIIFLFKLHKRFCSYEILNWKNIELGYYVVVLLFLFFGVLFLSIKACDSQGKAGCAFSWFGFVAYIVDFVMALKVFLDARRYSQSGRTTVTGSAPQSLPGALDDADEEWAP